jgi:hypothetical protein
MAKIIRREWTSKGPLGKRVRHVAFGYTLAINGTRERKRNVSMSLGHLPLAFSVELRLSKS